jgi:hypothetical protein
MKCGTIATNLNCSTDLNTFSELDTLEKMVAHYIKCFRPKNLREKEYYQTIKEFETLVEVAAKSHTEDGTIHGHQRRIGKKLLKKAASRLSKKVAMLQKAQTFEELRQAVEDSIGGIHGIGSLTIYDISCRIGYYNNIEPNYVYIHAGAKEGARLLRVKGKIVKKGDFPLSFSKLTPSEIEDFLCIYKNKLRGHILR